MGATFHIWSTYSALTRAFGVPVFESCNLMWTCIGRRENKDINFTIQETDHHYEWRVICKEHLKYEDSMILQKSIIMMLLQGTTCAL